MGVERMHDGNDVKAIVSESVVHVGWRTGATLADFGAAAQMHLEREHGDHRKYLMQATDSEGDVHRGVITRDLIPEEIGKILAVRHELVGILDGGKPDLWHGLSGRLTKEEPERIGVSFDPKLNGRTERLIRDLFAQTALHGAKTKERDVWLFVQKCMEKLHRSNAD